MKKLLAVLLIIFVATTPAYAETWAEYSRMDEPAGGQLWQTQGVPTPRAVSQWQYNSPSTNVYGLHFGSPSNWLPLYQERLIKEDGWVMLDGAWNKQGVWEDLRVTDEYIADYINGECVNWQVLPVADPARQHYVKQEIPENSYCLDAKGSITNSQTGNHHEWYHRQRWKKPTGCSNTYFSNKTCIRQDEHWCDNYGQPQNPNPTQAQLNAVAADGCPYIEGMPLLQRTIGREVYYGKNMGFGFKIESWHPDKPNVKLRFMWLY